MKVHSFRSFLERNGSEQVIRGKTRYELQSRNESMVYSSRSLSKSSSSEGL
jgi:hypothetical protein